jgi:hypothetical protein
MFSSRGTVKVVFTGTASRPASRAVIRQFRRELPGNSVIRIAGPFNHTDGHSRHRDKGRLRNAISARERFVARL